MPRLPWVAALALTALVAGGCGARSEEMTSSRTASTAERPAGSAAEGIERSGVSTVALPDVVGLTEGEAVRALGTAGLVANVRYVEDVPRTGEVYRSAPAARSHVPAGSVVVLNVSLPPRLPPPGQEHEMEMAPLGELVQRHPEVFVGLYLDAAAVPHVVFGPGADPAAWSDRLTDASKSISYPAEGIGYRTDTCSRTHARLRAIQDEIVTNQDWTKHRRLAFGVWVQPETCTVRVESDLLREPEMEALVDRYGAAISFDTTEGSHPELVRSSRTHTTSDDESLDR